MALKLLSPTRKGNVFFVLEVKHKGADSRDAELGATGVAAALCGCSELPQSQLGPAAPLAQAATPLGCGAAAGPVGPCCTLLLMAKLPFFTYICLCVCLYIHTYIYTDRYNTTLDRGNS